MKAIGFIVLRIALILLIGFPAAAQTCNSMQSISPAALVSSLNGIVPNQTNAACVAFAINQLGSQQYEPAFPMLTKFLSFRWPPNARQKQRLFVLEHDGASIYPVANALEAIGKNALPGILKAIAAKSTSKEASEVAVSVWMTIYKTQAPLGVALLKQEARKTKDPESGQKLNWAVARAAMGWCSPSERDQCSAAAQLYSKPPEVTPGSTSTALTK